MRALAFSGGKDSMACLHLMKDSLDLAIYVDTGKSYPETQRLVEYASTLVRMVIVKTDRDRQNVEQGIPSDVVPVDWTAFGQEVAGKKSVTIQGYLNCCFSNLCEPLTRKAKELGVTEIVYGQRDEEGYKSPSRNGSISDGMVRIHPIEDWTAEEVLAYLSTKMDVPAHYRIKHSSLDCYDCTAFRKDSKDRVDWTKEAHPDLYAEYLARVELLNAALKESLDCTIYTG
jgi:phosphoadenosine phosphosulfate reductase